MFQQYNDKDLRKLQLIEVECMREFIRICDKFNLTYILTAGTAIGAVRHKGFVPWDDDIDLAMPAEEFYKFIKIAENELSSDFEIHYFENDPFFSVFGLTICKKGCSAIFTTGNFSAHIGVDVDPLFNVPDNAIERKRHLRRAWIWNKLYYLRKTPKPMIPLKGVQLKIASACCFIIHYILIICHISPKWPIKHYREYAFKYLGITETVTHLCDTNPETFVMKVQDIYPLQEAEFEGMSVKLPANNHELLTRIFGNYMELPPESERKNHFTGNLSFDENE